MQTNIKMIWSTDPNGYIGDGKNLIHISKCDLKNFKELTIGSGNNAIVMGRRTYESISSKPLPSRLNIVLSKNENFGFDLKLGEQLTDCHLSRNILDVLDTCEEHHIDTLWVIGGKEIYEQFIELSTELVITNFDQYGNNDPEKAIQFLPDLSQFKLYHSETISDNHLTGSINYWRRTI